jgi:hypothetical protein
MDFTFVAEVGEGLNEDFWGDPDTVFDETDSLGCDEFLSLNGDNSENCWFTDSDPNCSPAAGTNDDVVQFIVEQCVDHDDCASGNATVTEAEILGIIAEFSGDCDFDVLDEDQWDTYSNGGGLLCVVTNSVDLEAIPNLIITKECLSGDGDGDVDFGVVVTTDLGAAVDSDSLDCGEVMVVADLDEGTYRIQEFITGPNAALFLTAIVCTTAGGQTVTPGSLAEVELELGFDVECSIVNAFIGEGGDVEDPDAPAAPAPVVIVPIDIDNENTNTLNNDNINDNNNENTNTQEQSNYQEQTNDNNQTTTVNSSPSVVIDFND